MLELLIIGIYLLAMVTVGLVSRKKAKKADDFFVAGRRGSSLFITGSLLATIVGGSATVGMAGLGFTRGLTGAWWLLAGSVGLGVLGVFFAKRVRNFALYTLPEMVKEQYDGRVALAASILIVVAWIGIIAGQIVAAGKIMSVLGIGNSLWWMVLFTVVFVAYTVLGGQYAIIRTDTLQAVILFWGILTGLVLLLLHAGGLGELTSSLPSEYFSFPVSSQFDGYELVSLLLLVGLTYVVGPDIYSRLLSARDGNVARSSVFWAALLLVPFALIITVIGMGAAVLSPQIDAEQAFPTVITEVLPPLLGGVVLAALLCAIMSSADTCLMSASTILTVDVIKQFKPSLTQRQILALSRWCMVVLGVVALLLAYRLGGVINSLLFAYTIYTAGVILPVIAGFYKSQLKVTSLGALAAVIGGGGAALISKLLEIKYLDLGALIISGLLLFAVSFIGNRLKGRMLDADKGI